ncbi:hypothetical protein K435DRAFT_840650 [Dendrothele bispora CBS 962.96]|uniref:DUF6589 domain-containing protein n=1 Tax=Dendrothele bispora (strain CBS 962.96) TaxID=1314807 RepID=A0A4S8LRX3_DENBC|nr:hypothetical protein K435DRAFT_840650 [Dendrothele bispora CBS 962.96]
MTEADRDLMRQSTAEETSKGEVRKCYVLDNLQRQDDLYEGGLLRVKKMKCGTAGTEINIEDGDPNSFRLSDHLQRVVQNLRSTMTLDSLFDSINWPNHHACLKLYIVKTLADEVSEIKPYLSEIIERFRSDPIAIHRLPADRLTQIQPLGTNSEREVETQGMKRCIEDFDEQIGFTSDDLVEWVGGDGATFATILRLQKYLAPTAFSNRATLRNKIATPELWHAKDTAIKTIAQNHFGPSTSSDPSSLSKLYTSAGLKRPSNLKHCDHYPTVNGLNLIWVAQILDCWRIILNVDDLSTHFQMLANDGNLPTLDELLSKADILIQQYVSIGAYERVQSVQHQRELKRAELKVKVGSEWVLQSVSLPSREQTADISSVKDPENFDGDRSLANSILFKAQFGSWLLLEYAIKDGDIGRVLEQLKIWIFIFSGSTHQQYASYLLELHCLLEYETSPELRRTILSNYLVKFGLHYKERDLMQEDHNGKIEVMAPKAGGEFDGSYFREIITPNIHHLIDIGRNFESGFGLSHRKTTHTSPNMRPEIRALLSSIESSELHLFRAHRSYEGHIATDLFSKGYEGLGSGGKLDEFKRKTATRAKFIAAIENEKQRVLNTQNENDTAPSDTRMSDTSPSSKTFPQTMILMPSQSLKRTDSTESSSEEGSDHAESGSEIEVERMQDDGPEDEESEEDEIMEERLPDSSEDEENWSE